MANTSRSASQSTASTASAAHKRALVIVESPAKAKTINKYLGSQYIVKSSVGHVRDLPTGGSKSTEKKPAARTKLTEAEKEQKAQSALINRMGVDPEHDWKAHYEVLPGKEKEDAQVPMGAAATADAKSASPERVAKDISARNFSITAGMQIVQVIDLAIRNSSYIIDQSLTERDPQTGLEVPNKNAEGKPVQWYNISFEAKQGKYDALRNDFAYEVTFIISPY